MVQRSAVFYIISEESGMDVTHDQKGGALLEVSQSSPEEKVLPAAKHRIISGDEEDMEGHRRVEPGDDAEISELSLLANRCLQEYLFFAPILLLLYITGL
jgi:hypothetical protein